MILFIIITFVLTVWIVNKLLFGELFGGSDDEPYGSINDARKQQRQQYQQYQQFQQREYERQRNRNNEDGPIIIEKDDSHPAKKKRTIGDYGEYVDFKEVEE
ncbi:MAG: DUF4834 family protein [Bacteroidales bacterium]|nr:DUF4834 family protein [Bacteroidales bacterium]